MDLGERDIILKSRRKPSYARALEVVRQAEQLNFEVALIGRAYLGGPAIP